MFQNLESSWGINGPERLTCCIHPRMVKFETLIRVERLILQPLGPANGTTNSFNC